MAALYIQIVCRGNIDLKLWVKAASKHMPVVLGATIPKAMRQDQAVNDLLTYMANPNPAVSSTNDVNNGL
jgi:hypothetical protein